MFSSFPADFLHLFQVEYLLKKICTAMNIELNSGELDDYLSQEAQQQSGLTVWQFLDLVNSGRFLRGIEREAISMAVEEVYQEIIGDVLKQVCFTWVSRNTYKWILNKPVFNSNTVFGIWSNTER